MIMTHSSQRRTRLVRMASLLAVSLSLATRLGAQVISAPNNSFESSLGKFSGGGAFSTFAQTFVTPAAAPSLQSFTIFLGDDFGQGADLSFRAHVFEFNLTTFRLVGAPLYSSTLRTGSTNISALDAYLFNIAGGVTLNSGSTYALVVSALGTVPGTFAALVDGATNAIGTSSSNAYAGGSAYRSTATGSLADLALANAFQAADHPDLAFSATFQSTVPEPSTVLLVGAGLGLVMLLRRRRNVS